MYSGKFNHRRRLVWRREFVLLCSIVVLVLGMVGGSLAYLLDHTEDVKNTFVVPEIDVTIPEDFDGLEKKNVQVENKCEFPVFARATYVAYWQNDEGEVYSEVPEIDVIINTGNWTQNANDGYWYCNKILAAKNETGAKSPVFIESAKLSSGAQAPSEEYHLVIDVIAEVVQSSPAAAAQQVWGFTPTAS